MAPTPPRLSVVTFTNGPGPRVAASLRRVRNLAAEIVVAVDERVDPAELGPLRDVADRLIRAEFEYPLEANLAWLHAQATGDWVLRLDGDDVVSEALLRALATPGWDDGITHAYLNYRWLFGGPSRMLDQAPWWPDPVLRLIRRVPGIVRFATTAHEAPVVAGASRLLDLPLYHLDLLVQDETARRAKADGYERAAPGHRTDRGWSVNTTYYLPERVQPTPRTAPLPAVDVAAVEAVLAATDSTARPHGGWPGPPTPPAGGLPADPRVRVADRRVPPAAAGTSRIRVLAHEPVVVVPGRSTIVTVAATNRSAHVWSPDDTPPTVVGGRVLDAQGAVVGGELRADFPGPVAPGQEALARLSVPAPDEEGRFRLEVGLLQDGVAWHDGRITVGLDVRPSRRVLVTTGVSPFPHLGDDLITREILSAIACALPDVVPVLLSHSPGPLAARFGCEVVPSPATLPAPETGRVAEPSKRARDLVAQARRMAKGEAPADPMVAAYLAPFTTAHALVVAPGGGLASRYVDEALLPTAVEVLIARAFDLPVFVEGPSLGPFENRREHAAVAQIIEDANRVAVRDPSSADVARRIGKTTKPVVVADPATAALRPLGDVGGVARRWLSAHGIAAGRAYAVISLRAGRERPEHLAAVRSGIEALPDGWAAVYLPHCRGDVDDRVLIDEDPWMRSRVSVWDHDGDHAAAALIAGAAITFGTRFHLTVLAAASGVPAVALVADDYDRRRLRGHQNEAGVRIVERREPDSVGEAVTALLAAPRPEPLPWWEPGEFIAALSAALPPEPRLP